MRKGISRLNERDEKLHGTRAARFLCSRTERLWDVRVEEENVAGGFLVCPTHGHVVHCSMEQPWKLLVQG